MKVSGFTNFRNKCDQWFEIYVYRGVLQEISKIKVNLYATGSIFTRKNATEYLASSKK